MTEILKTSQNRLAAFEWVRKLLETLIQHVNWNKLENWGVNMGWYHLKHKLRNRTEMENRKQKLNWVGFIAPKWRTLGGGHHVLVHDCGVGPSLATVLKILEKCCTYTNNCILPIKKRKYFPTIMEHNLEIDQKTRNESS